MITAPAGAVDTLEQFAVLVALPEQVADAR